MTEENKGQTISLLEQVKLVSEARNLKQGLEYAKKESYARWEAENKDLLERIVYLNEYVAEAEQKLRELTLRAYNETGSKQPAPGVAVRELTRLEYDVKQALSWAIEHKICLSLDKRAFEGFAKATPLEFVEVWTELQATIATDLSKILLEVK